MADAHKPTIVKLKLPPLNPGYVIGRAGSDSTVPTYVACHGIFYPSPGFKGAESHSTDKKQPFYLVSTRGPFRIYTDANGVRKFRHGLRVSGPFPPGINLLTCNTAAEVSTTLHAQCCLMHNHAPSENLPVPPEGDVVWQRESLSKEEETDEDELESEEDMPLAQSRRLGQHGSSHASRTTEERPGDEHSGEQIDGSKEEKNSGVVLLQQQQQQDAEGNNAGGNGNGDGDGDKAAEQAVNQAGSGFVKVKILTKLGQLKSNDDVALWFTMPNGDVYRDPLRTEAAVSEAGFKNLKVTCGLGDAGMTKISVSARKKNMVSQFGHYCQHPD
ncbi:hypothetical protein B0H17DRAFT_1123888 [Mycena rosella]|uniref:Uncharacterized protein n=1 Tax=Mycena rosella TaxID=1033263 RepID=A0AAD7MCK7_MYCRO|nr:hypothetical protein B0H17DRAFT_1123888 [Mycena rosella]